MITKTLKITSLFAAAVMGISTFAVAGDQDPMAINPLAQPSPMTMQQPATVRPAAASQPQQQWQVQRQAVQAQTPTAYQQPTFSQPATQQQSSGVIVNDVPLSMDVVNQMRAAGMNVVEGDYWYDRACGAFGYKGGPTVGRIPPGLNLGGPMKADCSNGNSGVFVNGRQLTMPEALPLAQALRIGQGRYALDAALNFGYEGQAPAVNLGQLIQAAQQQQQPEQHKSLSERGMLNTPPLVVPGVGATGEGFSYTN